MTSLRAALGWMLVSMIWLAATRVGCGQPNDPESSGLPIPACDQRLLAQEAEQETTQREAAAQAKPGSTFRAGEGGFSLESADRAFQLRIRSLVQIDSRLYLRDGGLGSDDSFLIRRARLELAGRLFESFDFRIMPDFEGASPTLLDAWLDWNMRPQIRLLAGKVKLPVGLERHQSREHNLFAEFGYPTSLVPNRDIGVALHGELFNRTLDYYVGAFNGTVDGGRTVTDSDGHKSVAARLFATPFPGGDRAGLRGLGLGIAGTWGREEGALSDYRTVGQQTFFRWTSGSRAHGIGWRLVPQLHYFNGPFGLLAEHALSTHALRNGAAAATVHNTAWQVSASWVFTGENATFQGVKPARPVRAGAQRGWGAWQLAARATELEVDRNVFPAFADPGSSAARARSYGAAVNWYLNSQVRMVADYNWTNLCGSALRDEHAIITRIQFRF